MNVWLCDVFEGSAGITDAWKEGLNWTPRTVSLFSCVWWEGEGSDQLDFWRRWATPSVLEVAGETEAGLTFVVTAGFRRTLVSPLMRGDLVSTLGQCSYIRGALASASCLSDNLHGPGVISHLAVMALLHIRSLVDSGSPSCRTECLRQCFSPSLSSERG